MRTNPKTIWELAQNKPSLVVKDVLKLSRSSFFEMTEDRLYQILLNRGVFKWLAVRRDLIKLKDKWKRSVTACLAWKKEFKRTKEWRRYYFVKGYQAALEQCRAEVRALCHSQRWRAPDNDRKAQEWLESQTSSGPVNPIALQKCEDA
jgi:Leu/Phe-tRNA-protein transferase